MKLRPSSLQRLLSLAILLIAVAITVPLVPTRETVAYNLLSSEQEAQMGKEAFDKLKKEKKIIGSGSQAAMVNRVAGKMQRTISVPHAQWEFVLFEDASPNAFALPGGKVGIHTGLFRVAKNESQLAAVIGHELAHVTARHSGKRLSRAVVGTTLGGLAGAVLSRKTGIDEETAQQVTQGAVTLRVLQFSRSQELEADRTGAVYMAKAGYDPRESINLWKQMSEFKAKSGASAPLPFLSTHPMDQRRIEGLQEVMPEALAYYEGRTPPAPPTSTQPVAARKAQPTSAPASSGNPPKARKWRFWKRWFD